MFFFKKHKSLEGFIGASSSPFPEASLERVSRLELNQRRDMRHLRHVRRRESFRNRWCCWPPRNKDIELKRRQTLNKPLVSLRRSRSRHRTLPNLFPTRQFISNCCATLWNFKPSRMQSAWRRLPSPNFESRTEKENETRRNSGCSTSKLDVPRWNLHLVLGEKRPNH